MLLYETAMQVVPLMLIALFLDRRGTDVGDSRTRKWYRLQDKIITCLSAIAFTVSLLIVAEVLRPGSLFQALVIAALMGSLGLLFAQIWRRFDDVRGADSHRKDAAQS